MCIISKPSVNSTWSYKPETINSGQNWRFFLSRVTLKLDRLPGKTTGHLLYANSNFVHHFIVISQFKLRYKNWWFFVPCGPGIWQMTLKNNRPPTLCYFKLCASFHSHRPIQTGITDRKHQIGVKIGDLFVPCDGMMTLKNNRAPVLCYFKLCASFHSHRQFKLELQSGNAKFGSKSATFCSLWP